MLNLNGFFTDLLLNPVFKIIIYSSRSFLLKLREDLLPDGEGRSYFNRMCLFFFVHAHISKTIHPITDRVIFSNNMRSNSGSVLLNVKDNPNLD